MKKHIFFAYLTLFSMSMLNASQEEITTKIFELTQQKYKPVIHQNSWEQSATCENTWDQYITWLTDHNISHQTLFLAAAKADNIDLFSYILKNYNVSLNAQDELGNTPLHFAVDNRNSRFVLFLLKNGANPNISNFIPHMSTDQTYEGEIPCGTPLMSACWEPSMQSIAWTNAYEIITEDSTDHIDLEIIETLLTFGANPNAPAKQEPSITPLHPALFGRFNWEKLTLLLQYGGKPHFKGTDAQGKKITFIELIENQITELDQPESAQFKPQSMIKEKKDTLKRLLKLIKQYT